MGISRFAAARSVKLTVASCAHHCGKKAYVPRPVAGSDYASEEDIQKYRSARMHKRAGIRQERK